MERRSASPRASSWPRRARPTPPAQPPSGPNVHIYEAGIHRESLNPKSGETIYLAPGSYIFGSLNLWKVENVKVLGRGTIVYEGPQDPNTDEGWMQKPDWHCIGALEAHNVEIDGLTCIVRSRTWSIQMKDSTGFRLRRPARDRRQPRQRQPGRHGLAGRRRHDCAQLRFCARRTMCLRCRATGTATPTRIWCAPATMCRTFSSKHSELSTSISNIVRAGWPRKTFNSRNFTLRDSDILHGGIGACGQTFGLLGFWGANGAKGDHCELQL